MQGGVKGGVHLGTGDGPSGGVSRGMHPGASGGKAACHAGSRLFMAEISERAPFKYKSERRYDSPCAQGVCPKISARIV